MILRADRLQTDLPPPSKSRVLRVLLVEEGVSKPIEEIGPLLLR
jgi:hypothetical protein